jgi:hypothetical protein
MTASREMVREIEQVAKKLGSASVWIGSKRAVDAWTDDYVYELLCYFCIAAAAKKAFALRLSGRIDGVRKGLHVARWPKKPGDKKRFLVSTPAQIGRSCRVLSVMSWDKD